MKKFLIIPVIILFLSSCETWDYISIDELDFGDEENQITLFVEGGITTQSTYQRVYLYKPSNYINNTTQEYINSAGVFVTSGSDTSEFIPDTLYGFYESEHEFRAETGRTYTLHVLYEGRLYTATDSVVESGDFNFEEYTLPQNDESYNDPEYLSFMIKKHTYGFPQSNFWRWEDSRYFTDTANYLFQGMETSYTHQYADVQGLFSNIEYYFQVGYGFQLTDTLVAMKFSISDEYYEYLRAYFMETDWKEGVFSTLPGNLPTNLSDGGAGFFFASDVFVKKITIEELLRMVD